MITVKDYKAHNDDSVEFVVNYICHRIAEGGIPVKQEFSFDDIVIRMPSVIFGLRVWLFDKEFKLSEEEKLDILTAIETAATVQRNTGNQSLASKWVDKYAD